MESKPGHMIYKKTRKSKLKKLNFKINKLKFGTVGLKTCYSGTLSFKQIETAWQIIIKKIKKRGKLFTWIFCNIFITMKPVNIWMGWGKGHVRYKSSKIFGGAILFEICSINTNLSILALKAGANKLPIKTKIFS